VCDNEEDDVPQAKIEKKTFKPSFTKIEFVKPKQQEKTAKKTVNHVEQNRQKIHTPKGNQRNWNNMMSQRLGSNFEMFNKVCYVCGSFDHLQVDCKKVNQKQFQNTKPIWNNAQRVNHQNFTKKTHPCAKKNIVPRAVLMKSGLVSVNTGRQVNAAHTKTTVNAARQVKTTHSTVKRPIHKNTTFKNNNFNQRINTVKDKNVNTIRPKAVVNAARPKAVVNVVKGNNVNAVKASAYYEEIDGGYVAFRGNPKGGKITGIANYPKSTQDDGSKPSSDDEKKFDEDLRKDSESIDQEKDDNVNSTNNVNVASTNGVNGVGGKTSIELQDDQYACLWMILSKYLDSLEDMKMLVQRLT
ncbi:hypothetical protein Tco_0806898, partial [Tanacetum coccineum]